MLNRLNINGGLSKYVFDVSVQETDCLRRLREETATMPLAEMQIVPEEGQLLAFLVRLLGVRKALEIGVFTGYSSLWTAMALPADGSLVACDISKEWTDIAQRYWREAAIEDRIDLRLGPALETLNNLFIEGHGESFDFAFIDSDKENYPAYFECCIQLVRPGGLIVLDNMLRSGEVIDPTITETGTVQIRRLNECIKRDQRIFSCLLPVADGLQLVMKRPREISPSGAPKTGE
jgi:predicted O-methyltransferase YrrM